MGQQTEKKSASVKDVMRSAGGRAGLITTAICLIGGLIAVAAGDSPTGLNTTLLTLLLGFVGGIYTVGLLSDDHPTWALVCLVALPPLAGTYGAILLSLTGGVPL